MFLLLRASRYYNSPVSHELHLESTFSDWYCSHLTDKSFFVCREFKQLLSDHPQTVNGRAGSDISWVSCLLSLISHSQCSHSNGTLRFIQGSCWEELIIRSATNSSGISHGMLPSLTAESTCKSIALCCIHHHHHNYVHCYPQPNLPSAGVDSFSNLYMLVRKRRFKRENIQDIEIHKSNSKTVHSFQRQIEKRESWRRCQKLLKITILATPQLYNLQFQFISCNFKKSKFLESFHHLLSGQRYLPYYREIPQAQ